MGEFLEGVLSREETTSSPNANYFTETLGQSPTCKSVHGSLVRKTKKLEITLACIRRAVTQMATHFQKESFVPI